MKKDHKNLIKIIVAIVIILDILVWSTIFNFWKSGNAEIYFLDVGQGDGTLVIFKNNVKLLIDGGPMNGRVGKNLEEILPLADRYIDLIMVSHAQLDHFGGLIDVMKNFRVGAVLMSEYGSENATWKEFERVRVERKIPKVVIAQGDRILYGDSKLDILWPKQGVYFKDLNEVAIGVFAEIGGMRAFFGGDMGIKEEAELARKYDLDVDILKVSHHGSKFSSDAGFLKEASPLVSVIEVGKNSYGHPTKEALSRLAAAGSQIFRTDLDGFVKVALENGKLRVYIQK